MKAVKYYKVLLNGCSFHLGNLEWSLPKGKTPGKWMAVKDDVVMCSRGLHLTSEPARWYAAGAEVFECQHSKPIATEGDKCVVKKCKLTRKLTESDLADVRIFLSGSHEIRDKFGAAYGSSTVTACGSSTVAAYNSSTVAAYDSSTVRAYDSSTVRAYDSSTVRAYDSSTVRACGSSTVAAYNSSTVRAYGSSTINDYRYGGKTEVNDAAVLINRNGNKPTVKIGGES